MDIRITPGALSGKIDIPPSKSAAHRAAICAALAAGESALSPIEATADMLATIGAVRALGAGAELKDGVLSISGIKKAPASAVIDCGESGSTFRFLVPVAAALGVDASFRGHGRLPQRPMDELIRVLEQRGVSISTDSGDISCHSVDSDAAPLPNENAPVAQGGERISRGSRLLSCSGKLRSGVYEIGGGTSSQYITGLLFALPLLDGDSEIILTSPLESRGYVDMTIAALKRFGVRVSETSCGWRIPGDQKYKAQSCKIEADYSSAAFWLCGAALGGSVMAKGLDYASKQGDRLILELLTDVGAHVRYDRGAIRVSHGRLKGFDADVSQIPDLMPILSVLAAFSNGTSSLYNARRLRLKESDRLAATAAGLRQLGAGVVESSDKLVIIGQEWLRGGGVVDSFGDHRIAMSMSIAAAYCREPSVIAGAECVDKSYPGFYRDFAALGGICDVV